MKRNLFIFSVLILFDIANLDAVYVQDSKIVVIAKEEASSKLITKILTKFNVDYDHATKINCDITQLHVIVGDIDNYINLQMPKNYIFFNTKLFKNKKFSEFETNFLTKAIAVWDASWNNINQYKGMIKNYYYLPNENYNFLDPVLLPCFISVNLLDIYRDLLICSNASDTDISSHLPTLFCQIMMQQPKVIIEAGVRGGDGSTIPMANAAKLINADLIGIDTDDTSSVYTALNYQRAFFVKMNDLKFPDYFKSRNFSNKFADFIFIDTSHLHEHTMQEIKAFSAILAPNGILSFHDSNVTPLNNNTGYDRINNTKGSANGNTRGVTSAIKTYFNIEFDEHKYINMSFESHGVSWNLLHYPFCNGLTLIQKLA